MHELEGEGAHMPPSLRIIPETLQENWRLHRFFYYFLLPAACVSKLSFRSFRPGTSMNCLFDAILQGTAPKEKARGRITAAGLQAPAKMGSHWFTPQPPSYSVLVPFQLD